MKIWNDNSVMRLAALIAATGISLWGWLEISLRMLPAATPAPLARIYSTPHVIEEPEAVATLVVLDQSESIKAAR